MDSQQAKRILTLYRPGCVDDADPQVAEALAQAQRDPELGRWLEQDRAIEEAIQRKFRDIPVPAGLKQRIVADRTAISPLAWWRQPAWLAATAAVVILLIAGGFWYRSQGGDDFASYRKQMVRFVAKPYKLDFRANDLAQIQRTVAGMGWPSDYVVPKPLQTVALEGGCALKWRDHKVTLICWSYYYNYWLFVVERAAIPDSPADGAPPQFKQFSKITTASWTAGDKVYIVAAIGDEQLVRTLL